MFIENNKINNICDQLSLQFSHSSFYMNIQIKPIYRTKQNPKEELFKEKGRKMLNVENNMKKKIQV